MTCLSINVFRRRAKHFSTLSQSCCVLIFRIEIGLYVRIKKSISIGVAIKLLKIERTWGERLDGNGTWIEILMSWDLMWEETNKPIF